jgi:thiol:disulfide interchange protein DsbD
MTQMLQAVVFLSCLVAQSSVAPASKPAVTDTAHLTITTSTSVETVAPGGRATLVVDVVPKPRMHVYAPEQKAYLPVSLQVDRNADVTSRPPIFPKGESFFFAPTSETQIVYSHPFRIEVPVSVAKSRKPGTLALGGTLRYQACDDKVCYLPKSVPMTWKLTVR